MNTITVKAFIELCYGEVQRGEVASIAHLDRDTIS